MTRAIWQKKWFPWLVALVSGLALGAVLTILIFTDKHISIRISLTEGTIEVSGGPVQLPAGTIDIIGGRAYIITKDGAVPLRAYFEAQGYLVSWDSVREEIILEKGGK